MAEKEGWSLLISHILKVSLGVLCTVVNVRQFTIFIMYVCWEVSCGTGLSQTLVPRKHTLPADFFSNSHTYLSFISSVSSYLNEYCCCVSCILMVKFLSASLALGALHVSPRLFSLRDPAQTILVHVHTKGAHVYSPSGVVVLLGPYI